MTKLVRINRPEIMDVEKLSDFETEGVIKFLNRVNRWFGGHSLILNWLEKATKRLPKNLLITILDVGTGSGDLLIALAKWSRSNGRRLRIVGLEKSNDLAIQARRRCADFVEIEIKAGDLIDETNRFDFVVSNLVLHHIEPFEQIFFLRHCDRIATYGMLICDLERSWPNFLAVAAASFLWGNRVVRNDGPLSVKRSFTPDEAKLLVDLSELNYLAVHQEPWCRLSIGGLKS